MSVNIISQGYLLLFNTDKLADAVKEANIRLKEMPDATSEAVKQLGLDVTKIQSDIPHCDILI